MNEYLVKQVARAALRGEIGEGGWLKIQAPRTSAKEISFAVMEAKGRGLVEACNVQSLDSHYPEWRLQGPTAATERFIRENRASKKAWAVAITIAGWIFVTIKWLIPILISLIKK